MLVCRKRERLKNSIKKIIRKKQTLQKYHKILKKKKKNRKLKLKLKNNKMKKINSNKNSKKKKIKRIY